MNRIERHLADLTPALRRHARGLVKDAALADDLVQDCLEKALMGCAALRPDSDVRAWAFTILRHVWLDHLRRQGHRPDRWDLDETMPPIPSPALQMQGLMVRDLETCLGLLPPAQREVILLVAVEGLSYAQVADMLTLPPGTVMSRLKRGRDRLAELMAGSGPALRRVK